MLIINADDFGRDADVNRAVPACFEKGLCSSTTIMANMPGFEEACELAHERRLLQHVGLHLVLRDGHPVSGRIRAFPRFCDREGRLCLARRGTWPMWHLNRSELDVLAEEIREQVRRCRAHGLPLTHLDSHYHLHADWAVFGVVLAVVREEGIPFVRIARNCGRSLDRAKRVYKWVINTRLRQAKLARTRYFGTVNDFLHLRDLAAHASRASYAGLFSLEVSIHPRLNSEGHVAEHGVTELQGMVCEIDRLHEAVSFSGARYH